MILKLSDDIYSPLPLEELQEIGRAAETNMVRYDVISCDGFYSAPVINFAGQFTRFGRPRVVCLHNKTADQIRQECLVATGFRS